MPRQDITKILIDWGTSSFRLWCLTASGEIAEENLSGQGMKFLDSNDYETILEAILSDYGVPLNVPVLICGMAGAKQGWKDAGYLDTPCTLNDIAHNACRVETQCERDVRILPGLAQRDTDRPDVMRGEETLLLGAALNEQNHSLYCLPGTHSKWVFLENGQVSAFSTFMTGELFELLSEHSTLKSVLAGEEANFDKQAFLSGLDAIFKAPDDLTQALFKLRASSLLWSSENSASRSSRLSGLLIGAEIASMHQKIDATVGLVANGVLGKMYMFAFDHLEITSDLIDSKHLALTGLSHAAQITWENNGTI